MGFNLYYWKLTVVRDCGDAMKKDDVIYFFGAYLFISVMLWMMRFGMGADCEKRYIDYIFPITLLHCKVESK